MKYFLEPYTMHLLDYPRAHKFARQKFGNLGCELVEDLLASKGIYEFHNSNARQSIPEIIDPLKPEARPNYKSSTFIGGRRDIRDDNLFSKD